MKKIYLLGECMVELSRQADGSFNQSYAGDVYNTAVYLKRSFADLSVNLFSVIGRDALSKNMLAAFEKESIGTELIQTSTDKLPGLYMIALDDQGERSFSYWRSDSAARQVMQFLNPELVGWLCMGDVFFFSGISLAMIDPNDRDTFWQLLRKLSDSGVQIAFDPNYRPRMWSDKAEAKTQFELAFGMSNMVLPGVDDFDQLYGIKDISEIHQFCSTFNIDELIIKSGSKSVFSFTQNECLEIQITPVAHAVDTTSAGDSFNGVYLGARMEGISIQQSIELASAAAAEVIQYRGAIIPKDTFVNHISPLLAQTNAVPK
ncbi:sugar kinase [Echinimonas agarilytica]|uniref:Sugar kinase n=1 Tax=Echinimonas agarilytica TaxID=1215918 RepID=A0AA42B8Y9_9GAMM|nr:sugar kinase [Echinimonas agarilytica]MCM2680741.1 sugar kinase [Echinimonas agarilytica]